MTQCERIVDYINRFGSITQIDAIRDLGCMRLASRISDLKKRGIAISKTMEKGKNRFEEPIAYARYSFGEKK